MECNNGERFRGSLTIKLQPRFSRRCTHIVYLLHPSKESTTGQLSLISSEASSNHNPICNHVSALISKFTRHFTITAWLPSGRLPAFYHGCLLSVARRPHAHCGQCQGPNVTQVWIWAYVRLIRRWQMENNATYIAVVLAVENLIFIQYFKLHALCGPLIVRNRTGGLYKYPRAAVI